MGSQLLERRSCPETMIERSLVQISRYLNRVKGWTHVAENKYKKGNNKQIKVGCSTNGTIEKETKCYELQAIGVGVVESIDRAFSSWQIRLVPFSKQEIQTTYANDMLVGSDLCNLHRDGKDAPKKEEKNQQDQVFTGIHPERGRVEDQDPIFPTQNPARSYY